MTIGIAAPIPAYKVNAGFLAKEVERLGFESIWYAEHPIIPVNLHTTKQQVPSNYPYFVDPYIALSQASGATSKIKLGTGITLIPERNPLIMAKAISTLDLFSGGRFILGVGTGWLREETEIMGGDFDHRWTQTEESLTALKELWTKNEAEFHGNYYDFPPVKMFPKPKQKPHPPILIGGKAKNVFKRIVRCGNGWLPNYSGSGVTPQDIEHGKRTLEKIALDTGKDPGKFTISIHGMKSDKQLIEDFKNSGADRVIIRPNLTETESETTSELEKIATQAL